MRSGRISRLALWLVFVLTTGYVIGEQRHETRVREAQLCQVVVNVHNNSVQRLATSERSLKITLRYLKDPASHDTPSLRRVIVANLPATRARVAADRGSVAATRVPPVCQKYNKPVDKKAGT